MTDEPVHLYYMLRVECGTAERCELAGLVEQLGTGDKRTFRTAAELLNTLHEWDAVAPAIASAPLETEP